MDLRDEDCGFGRFIASEEDPVTDWASEPV
jgi:hypothetical protein